MITDVARLLVNFRLPADLYREAQRIAAARDETITQVVVAALRDYVERHRDRYPRPPTN